MLQLLQKPLPRSLDLHLQLLHQRPVSSSVFIRSHSCMHLSQSVGKYSCIVSGHLALFLEYHCCSYISLQAYGLCASSNRWFMILRKLVLVAGWRVLLQRGQGAFHGCIPGRAAADRVKQTRHPATAASSRLFAT